MPGNMHFRHIVYVLGAGFSHEAEVPLQKEIIDTLRKLDLYDAPPSLVDKYLNALEDTSTFLQKVFGPEEDPLLEDLFTLLDETVSKRQYCRGYSWLDMERVARSLNELILYLFHLKQNNINQDTQKFYNLLAVYWFKQCLDSENLESFSIISLNWDCVIDNAFSLCLSNSDKDISIDYGCYCSSISESDNPNFTKNPKQTTTNIIKIRKLHGSTNWLLCPNCGRLFVGLGISKNLWLNYILGASCPKCSQITDAKDSEIQPPILEPFLITPTFTKKFENPHIKMVWHNAYIELYEADQVVFIGYSLPEADYHLRTLFKRAIRHDTKIDIVLAPIDKPKKGGKGVTERYERFFKSSETLNFFYDGVKGYFGNKIKN